MNWWTIIVTLVCLALLGWLLWVETRRATGWRALRILCSTTATACLCWLGININITTSTGTGSQPVAVLATPGYSQDSITDFSRNKNIRFFATTDAAANAERLEDVGYLHLNAENFSAVHVFGSGLTPDQLASLGNTAFIFHPSSPADGFTSISWTRQVVSGNDCVVQGIYKNNTNTAVQLRLQAFESMVDSVIIAANSEKNFSLIANPKHIGRAVLYISAITERDTLIKEKLPVEIISATTPSVLLLSSSPDFENKFLKNWLVDNGYEVVSKNTISRSRYSREIANSKLTNADDLSADMLANFDVLVADEAALTSEQLRLIEQQVSQRGMGLLIRADNSRGRRFYSSLFKVRTGTSLNRENLSLYIPDTSQPLGSLSVQQAARLVPESGFVSLVTDKQGGSIAGSGLYGEGKVVATSLSETYSWILSGREKEYHRFWSTLLNEVARKKTSTEQWFLTPALAIENEPAILNLKKSSTSIPVGLLNGATVYLEQKAEQPFYWQGRYWPMQSGWVKGIGTTGDEFYSYVFAKGDWSSVRQTQNRKVTLAAASSALAASTGIASPNDQSIPLWIAAFIFFLSAVLLWIIGKIGNTVKKDKDA